MAPHGGWLEHAAAVDRLQASYAAIDRGEPVRLAKHTSNLFRPRTPPTAARGLDVSGLTGVIEVDPVARTAEVQGMCTYEHLVDATLPHGLMPYVVPQLRTITLGGAVSGLGIEATSFRNGFPHESVLEMDIFTGAGEVVTTRPGEDLFDTFPNSYGSLGYATRLRIALEAVPGRVRLRHVRFDDRRAARQDHRRGRRLRRVRRPAGRRRRRRRVRAGGVLPDPGDAGRRMPRRPTSPRATTPGRRSTTARVQQRETDLLTTYDYLWRWDTDWFWCSGAFGVQHPVVRRLWPRRWRRSDVYHKLVGLDRRFSIADRLDRRAGRPRARAGDPGRRGAGRPAGRVPRLVRRRRSGCVRSGCARCAAKRAWPIYPLDPDVTYVNVGFWGTVHVGPEAADAPRNRAIEAKVQSLGGHKSLYSEAFYDRDTFDQLYDGAHLARVKAHYDPDDRLTSLYDKAVRRG